MLYITTRNNEDTFTAYKALTSSLAADGGRFVPFRLPRYTAEEIAGLKNISINQTIADILNLFFSSRLASGNLDLRIGKNMLRVVPMNHRIVVAELWHNLEGNFSYIENTLYNTLTDDQNGPEITDWVRLSVRIAMLFGLYGELLRAELLEPGQTFDISVPNDSFVTLMAAWYCRTMGLPVNKIICSCEDGNAMWDFINRGVLNTNSVSKEGQLGIERLLQGTFGCAEAERFRQVCDAEQAYSVSIDALPAFNRGLFCSVVGKDRIYKTINSVFRSSNYIMDPQAALCYSGLQDYRAKTGESVLTVILGEGTPMDFTADICEATGISADKLQDHINHS